MRIEQDDPARPEIDALPREHVQSMREASTFLARFPFLLALACFLGAPARAEPPAPPMEHVAWSRSASIYEVNVRQFSAEGTLQAVDGQLERIRAMGVDILWVMPIQPIGSENRKGSLGSYYSIRDYTDVNPGMGGLDDFRRLVSHAHALGMHVILDWVANHTAWDHPWIRAHPGWYRRNEKGEITSFVYHPGPNAEYWTDVVGLDYRSTGLREAMIDAMAYWIRAADIDGFRCDVASEVPTGFWVEARRRLAAIKPIFLLAESAEPSLHENAFDMTYDWDLHDLLRGIAKGKADAASVRTYLAESRQRYPASAYRMLFTSNHDKNSWEGSDVEFFGDAFPAMAVLAATLQGMPLVYGGQEAGLDKRVSFFEKDPIEWKRFALQDFYRGLLLLRRNNPSLAAGQYGAPAVFLETGNAKVLAFERALQGNRVQVEINLSGAAQAFHLAGGDAAASLPAWGWKIRARGGLQEADLP